MKRLIAFMLSVIMLVPCFSFDAFALDYDEDTIETMDYRAFEPRKARSSLSESVQSRSVIGAIGTVVTVFDCIEYLEKTVKTLDAVSSSVAAGESLGEICNTAIDAFIGRSSTIVQGTDHAQKIYKEMAVEITAIHKKISGLGQDLQDINKSISDLANTIIVQNNKVYINEFQKNYVDLSDEMLSEYDQLMGMLDRHGDHIDNVKLSYDDLYIAADRLNDQLFKYMTGNYRDDGKAIQDVMYDYVNASDKLTQTEKNEKCIDFAENLFATYALSQYCLLICRLYQLDYCHYYGLAEYTTQNEAPEALPEFYIASLFQNMSERYEQIVLEIAKYIINKGHYDMEMLYISAKMPDMCILTYNETQHKLYKGDRYYYCASFPEKYKYIFGEENINFVTSDESVALIKTENEIQVLNNGRFELSMTYRGKEVAKYDFIVQDRFMSGGYGTAGAPYLIGTERDFSIALTHNPSAYYKLISNIKINGTYSNFCFPNFSGVFDGNGYAISNLTIVDAGADHLGMFGNLNSAVVKNLTLKNFIVKVNAQNGRYQNIGVLVGRNAGTVYNCVIESSCIQHDSSLTAISAPYQKRIGGIVGYNIGVIENCQSTNFGFYNNIRVFDDFIGKRYLISVGGLVGETCGRLNNNLVVNPYISIGQLNFEDYYVADYPIGNYCNLSCGLIAGNKTPNSSEAMLWKGSLSFSARAVMHTFLNSVSAEMKYFTYFGNRTDNLSPEGLAYYRLRNSTSIDRDVYKNVSIATAPTELKATYGHPWHITGILLRLEYVNGMTALVPITAVQGFNPFQLGDQTVSLTYRCGNGKILSTTVNVNVECAHAWTPERMTVVPKCEMVGEVRKTCTRCGCYETREIKALGHTYGEWIAEVSPTCENEGIVGHYHCSTCEKNFDAEKHELGSIVVSVLEHDMVSHPARAETCTEHGWIAYETCSRCTYTTYTEIPARGHIHESYDYDADFHWSICALCENDYEHASHVYEGNVCVCGSESIKICMDGSIDYSLNQKHLTIKNKEACVVAYKDDDSSTFVCIDAEYITDGYSFKIPESIGAVYIAIKGDYNANGELTMEDVVSLHKAILGKSMWNNTEMYVYDINGDGKITALDLALINATIENKISLWQK